MMERVCRRCGRVYRGLVCQACHPRQKKQVGEEGVRNVTLPVVIDLDGAQHDWAWLRAKYGNVSYLEAAAFPKFQLVKVEEMTGQAIMQVNLLDENGIPHSGQPVVLSWPSMTQPSNDIPAIPAGSKSMYTSRGVVQRTENGCTGFGLGGGSYIHDPATGGPYTVWVLSPSTYSDAITGSGWLGGSNHTGPCRLTFRIVLAGVTPEPDPEPEPTGDMLIALARIEAKLDRLSAHLGA